MQIFCLKILLCHKKAVPLHRIYNYYSIVILQIIFILIYITYYVKSHYCK